MTVAVLTTESDDNLRADDILSAISRENRGWIQDEIIEYSTGRESKDIRWQCGKVALDAGTYHVTARVVQVAEAREQIEGTWCALGQLQRMRLIKVKNCCHKDNNIIESDSEDSN